MSARNRFRGTVTWWRWTGCSPRSRSTSRSPSRLVAIITRDAVEELGLRPGLPATAVVKSTSVMVEG